MIKKPREQSLFDKYQEDFLYCEEIIKKHSKTFYAAFSSLPKKEALSVYAIYAYCRKADDVVDEANDSEGLAILREELELFEIGEEVNHPVWRALRVVFETYEMDIAPFYDMITGQEMDLSFKQPETQEDVEKYSYYVAGTVGLMMLPLLTATPKKVQEEAVALGTAMQLTNILRDVGEDLENQRVYLPKDVMAEYGYTMEMLKNKTINQAFIDMWEYEAQEAEKHYTQALKLIDEMNEKAKKPLLLSLLYYREILEAVRLNDYDCFSKRAVIKKRRKVELFKQAGDMLK
jgi:phytoene synthase